MHKSLIAALVFAAGIQAASAATITVDSTADTVGTCADGHPAGTCTLRAAVTQANTATDADTINFTVSGTITIGAAFPAITAPLSIVGPGARITLDGADANGLLVYSAAAAGAGSYALSNVTLTNGRSTSTAGGGALRFAPAGSASTLTLSNVNVTSSTATLGPGGGITVGTGNTVLFSNGTISGNEATNMSGGGIFVEAGGVVLLRNCTIASNTATSGGGIASPSNNAAASSMLHCTVALNTATTSGATAGLDVPAAMFPGSAGAPFSGNIVSHTGDDCANAFTFSDGAGSNLDSAPGDCGFDFAGQDAKLGTLASRGGTSQTINLLWNSPAIDQGHATLSASLPFDQRGAPAADGDGVAGTAVRRDIGAYEFGGLGVFEFEGANVIVPEEDAGAANQAEIFVLRRGDLATASSVTAQTTTGGTATATDDYTSTTTSLNWTTSEGTAKAFTFNLTADNSIEGDETVRVLLSGQTTGADLGRYSGVNPDFVTVTIDDYEPGVLKFAAATFSVAESAGTTPVVVVQREPGTGSGDGTVTVDYTVTGGSATSGSDYEPIANGTLTFAPGETSKSITVVVKEDTEFEDANPSDNTAPEPDPETITFSISNPTGGARLDTTSMDQRRTATLNITDNDAAVPGVIGFDAASYSASETAGQAVITLKRTGGNDSIVCVGYATADGTASSLLNSDYTASSGTVTWNDNDAADKTFTVPITNDTSREADETVTVTLSKPATCGSPAQTNSAAFASPNPATISTVLSILSDEKPRFRFTGSAFTASEGGNATVVVEAVDAVSGGPVSIELPVTPGTASTADYGTPSATGVTFTNGAAANSTQSITIPITGSDGTEPEERFNVALANATGGGELASPATAEVVITGAPQVQFRSATFASTDEAAGGLITLQVQRVNSNSGAVTVQYEIGPAVTSGSPGTATFGTDYDTVPTNTTTGTLTWASGDGADKFIQISVKADRIVEQPDETVTVRLKNPSANAIIGAQAAASAVITDDDIDLVFETTTPSQNESGNMTVVVRRVGITAGAVSVNYASSDNGSAAAGTDYTAASGTLNWANGDGANKSFNVPITTDTTVESDETFTLTLSGASAAADAGPPATATILDDDGTVSFAAAAQTVGEGPNSTPPAILLVTVTVNRTGATGYAVSVPFTVSGTASASDYMLDTSPIAIASGAASGSRTFQVLDDSLDEADETIVLTMGTPDAGTRTVTAAAPTVHTVTVSDDDTAGVTVTQSGGSTAVTEGGATDTYTIVLNSQPTADVTIAVTGDADVGGGPTPLTFTTANWNVAQTVTVTAVNDAQAEGTHSGTLAHAATSADTGYDGIAVAPVVASVTDNDVAGITVTQSGGATAVAEGGATDTLTVALASQPTADVTITAAPGSQLAVSPATLTFTPANYSVPQTVTVSAVDDATIEGTHTASLGGSAASADAGYNGALTPITVTISDNDTVTAGEGAPGIVVTPSGNVASTSEGGGGAFSWTALLGLLGLAGLRRRGLAVALALLSGPALAQAPAKAKPAPAKPAATAKSKLSYTSADLRYLVVSVDEPSVDASGFALAGSWAMNSNVFLTAAYGTVETDDVRLSGVVGSSKTDTLAVGIGGHYPIDARADLVGALTILSAEAQGQGGFRGSSDDTGWGLEAGVRGRWVPTVEWNAALSYVSIFDDDDTALSLQTQYHVSRDWGILAGVGFGSNATQLNFGARYNF